MSREDIGGRIDAVRRFDRYWTRKIGVLREARILLEISHRGSPTVTDLSRGLGLDQGYLSRVLGHLEERGLLARAPSEAAGRRRVLSLTPERRRSPC